MDVLITNLDDGHNVFDCGRNAVVVETIHVCFTRLPIVRNNGRNVNDETGRSHSNFGKSGGSHSCFKCCLQEGGAKHPTRLH